MKNLLLIFTLLFSSVFFSSTSFAEWTKVSEGENGNTFYVDFKRIRKHDGFVYYWGLDNFLKPDVDGDLSVKKYMQVDCNLLRRMLLSGSSYNEPMGGGISSSSYTPKNPEWTYPIPNSSGETILKSVCSR